MPTAALRRTRSTQAGQANDPIEGADVRDQPGLTRRLGTVDAVVIGLGSMIGAGVFSAFAPAAAAAGTGLLVGLGIAAVVAYCNATASAQLAVQYPTSGGTYCTGGSGLPPASIPHTGENRLSSQ